MTILIPLALALGLAQDAPRAMALFDGKSLDGWKAADYVNSPQVKVQDGAIVLPAGRPMSGVTTTRTDLPTVDYELTYEARRTSGKDFFAACTFPVGKGFITLVNGGWSGSVTGLSSLDGADASENETNKYFKYEDDHWYRFRVRVTGTTIRCEIDGKELVALNYEGRQLTTRMETRRNQPLGFATYNSTGEIRKVEVRKLAEDEVKKAHKPGDD
ncbi:MAG: DUF1080 domain-containing protein [Isosphaeraceae bacterium]